MKKLYLIRGVSGSGKSTLAKELFDYFDSAGVSCAEVAADDYFMVDGEYKFDARKLGFAHMWCQEYVESIMDYEKLDAIFVHNTFTTEKEMKPYLELAEEYGYQVVSLIVENRHGNSSVHDVPDVALKRQRKRLRANIQL